MAEDHTQPQHDGGRIVATDAAEHDGPADEANSSQPEDQRQNAERRIVASDPANAAPEEPDAEEDDGDDEDDSDDATSQADSVIRL
jgi:hypothetical protein